MKYSQYPGYRNSGVEWLGNIPSKWYITKHKYIATFSKGKNPSKLHDDNIAGTKKYLSMDYLRGSSDPLYGEIESNSYIVEDKQPLIIWDGSNAGEFVSGVNGILSSTMAASRLLTRSINSKYYWYVCKTIEPEMRKHSNGMGIPHVNGMELRNINLLQPPMEEQQTIANYLDISTAKIDTLIEKQTKLIELLKEKRQAVISTAVTRGLDNTVAMKDSGVEWLGEIPEHWRLPQIARILLLMEQGRSPECDNNVADLDVWGVLKTSCVNNAIYNSEANKTLPSSIQPFTQYEVKEEDILMSRASGSINLIGSVAYVYETRSKILLSDKIFRLYVDKSVNKIFFTYLMGSEYMRTNIKMAISGGEGMANNIAKSSITKFKMALPSIDEQHLIVKYIDDKISKIDKLIGKSTKAIELLKEKRTALISSAVTGKIDVRELNRKSA